MLIHKCGFEFSGHQDLKREQKRGKVLKTSSRKLIFLLLRRALLSVTLQKILHYIRHYLK